MELSGADQSPLLHIQVVQLHSTLKPDLTSEQLLPRAAPWPPPAPLWGNYCGLFPSAQRVQLTSWCRSVRLGVLVLLLGQKVLEELVHRPGDGSGGHLVYDASLDAFEESCQATEAVHCPEGVGHSRQVAADVHRGERHVLLGVEQRLTNVERRGDGRGDGSCRGAWNDVAAGMVMSVGVQLLLHQFVGDEVNGLERDVHGQLGAVAAVERPDAFSPSHRLYAVPKSSIWRVVHLHPLLDHWEKETRQHVIIQYVPQFKTQSRESLKVCN